MSKVIIDGYTARLLTALEVNKACGNTDMSTNGYLDNCNYLLENTKYSSDSISNYGYWLETPPASSSDGMWYVYVEYCRVNRNNANRTGTSYNRSSEV